MLTWITLHSFVLPQDAHVAKAKLESEGIPVFLKDELVNQTHNFYSHATNGVKLQVPDHEVKRALKLMVEGGFIIPEDPNEIAPFWELVLRITDPIPFLNKLAPELRLVLLITSIILLSISILLIIELT